MHELTCSCQARQSDRTDYQRSSPGRQSESQSPCRHRHLAPEGISMDLANQAAMIGSCGGIRVQLSIETRSAGAVRRAVFSQARTVIPPHTRQALPVHGAKRKSLDLPKDRDMLFEPGCKQEVSVFAHIVDHTMNAVFVQNDSEKDVVIPRNTRIGDVVEYEADGCYLATPNDAGLAAKPAKSSRSGWWKRALATAAVVTATAGAFYSGTSNASSPMPVTPETTSSISTLPETILPNGITIYGTSTADVEKLASYNICLSPNKSYLGYPSVALLGQRVDALGLSTAAEKLAAISKLAFPRNLRQLETYLGMTGFLRQCIPYYAAIIKPLQLRKTALNRSLHEKISSIGGNARKKFVGRLGVSAPTLKELCAFRYLQSLFSRPSMLVHHDPKRQMYINMDGPKLEDMVPTHITSRRNLSRVPGDLRHPCTRGNKQSVLAARSHFWPPRLQSPLFTVPSMGPCQVRDYSHSCRHHCFCVCRAQPAVCSMLCSRRGTGTAVTSWAWRQTRLARSS